MNEDARAVLGCFLGLALGGFMLWGVVHLESISKRQVSQYHHRNPVSENVPNTYDPARHTGWYVINGKPSFNYKHDGELEAYHFIRANGALE